MNIEKIREAKCNIENLSVLADGLNGLAFVYWDSIANGAFAIEKDGEYEHAAWAIQRLAEELATKLRRESNKLYAAEKESE